MKFELLTLFPDYFTQSLRQSLIGKAWSSGLFDIVIINVRDFATDRHRTVDDTPYGGGGGMVMKVEPLDRALQSLGYRHRREQQQDKKTRIVLTSAAGVRFTQSTAVSYSLCDRITIICGHYLGVDERIIELYDLDEVSVGDYILTGGEPAAATMVDAVARLIPKVLGNFESAMNDSYMDDLLGTPVYTRPADYEGLAVPEPLVSGDHAMIGKFRRAEAIRKCLRHRPDLIDSGTLEPDELKLVGDMKKQMKI